VKGRLWSNFFFIDKRVVHRIRRSERVGAKLIYSNYILVHIHFPLSGLIPVFLFLFLFVFFHPFFTQAYYDYLLFLSPLFIHTRDCTLHSLSSFLITFISTDMHRGA